MGSPQAHSEDQPESDIQAQRAMDIVFSSNKLIDKILNHVIYPPSPASIFKRATGGREINYVDIPNLRLVEKSFLFSVSRIFHQNRRPLFHLHNLEKLPVFIANKECHNELINNYKKTLTPPPTNFDLVPPTFQLSLICSIFIPENHRLLARLFKKWGTELTSLHVIFPQFCTIPGYYPSFSLPILRRLTIQFVDHSHSNPNDQNTSGVQNNIAAIFFLRQIFESCSELKTIEFKAIPRSPNSPRLIPASFGNHLTLPQTVKTLSLQGACTPQDLGIMFPEYRAGHIKYLSISLATPILDRDAIKTALDRHCGTLKKLKLTAGNQWQQQPSILNIPFMRRLEQLTISSNWRVVNSFRMISADFPRLKVFKLNQISDDLFKKITARGEERRVRLNSVKKLQVWLVNQENGFTLGLDEEKMKLAHCTFRLVTKLKMTIGGGDISGIKYIFKEMRKLTSLGIILRDSEDGDEMTCAKFDVLFGGVRIPEAIAETLQEYPRYLQYLVSLSGNENNLTIMNLKKLTKVSLATKKMRTDYTPGGDVRNGLLSEESFEFGLLKLPKLKYLTLSGRFKPSQKMMDIWKNLKETGGLGELLIYGSAEGGI